MKLPSDLEFLLGQLGDGERVGVASSLRAKLAEKFGVNELKRVVNLVRFKSEQAQVNPHAAVEIFGDDYAYFYVIQQLLDAEARFNEGLQAD